MSQLNARILGGRYRLLDRVGRGGMGAVWRARDELLGREVAVKEIVLPPGLDQEHLAEARGRAVGEARAAAQVRHPAVVTIHDVVMEGDHHWIVMEYIKARSLDDHLQDRGALPVAEVARIGAVLVGALQAVHDLGILHRDVKPANILLDDDGHVVLTDFGIATIEGDARLTASGFLIGTPGYMAPERLRGDPAGPPSDLWSLGAVLFTAVEGHPPYQGNTPMVIASAILTHDQVPLRRGGPLSAVILGLLTPDPADRLDARATADRLAKIVEGRGLDSPAGSWPQPDPQVELTRRNPPGEGTGPVPAASPGDDGQGRPNDLATSPAAQVKYRTRTGPVLLAAVAGAVLVAVAAAAIGIGANDTGDSAAAHRPETRAGNSAAPTPSKAAGDPSVKPLASGSQEATISPSPETVEKPAAVPHTKKPTASGKPTTIRLRARSNKKFVALDPDTLTLAANRTGAGQGAKFTVTYVGHNDIQLKVKSNGKFVTADGPEGTKPLIANRDAASDWETFLLVRNSDGSVSLLSRADNKYVTANNGTAPLIANHPANDNSARFDLIPS
ncbi:hypothetical protein GCM10022221_64840 [Actinocorallia aurea]